MQVIITRAATDAQATAQQVADLGCIPVVVPHSTRLGLPVIIPDQHLMQVPMFCVGDATATLARHTGFATVFSAAADVTALINLVRDRLNHGQSLLYLTGDPRKPDIEQALSDTMRLTTLTTYRMQTIAAFPQEALAQLDDPHPVWLHYSQQSVERAAMLVAASQQPDLFSRARHLLISPALQSSVKAGGGIHVTISAQPNQQAMLDSLLTMRKALML